MSNHHRSHSRTESFVPVWILILLIGVFVAVLVWQRWNATEVVEQPRPVTPRGELADDEKTTIELFQKAASSVVHITTVEVRRDFFLNVQKIPRGTGSGFVWDEKGRVVTNYHVVESAARNRNEVRVNFADQRADVPASIIGIAPSRDLAVLQLHPERASMPGKLKLQPILVGASDDLQVGQKVFAIGNPFGLDQTLTTGVVSGLGREVSTEKGQVLKNLIQTDAAINPGNSGGPLLDSAGRLIGVNTAILSPSGAFAGIGFAIPVDEVNYVVTTLINRQDQKKELPSLGIDFLPDHLTQRLGIDGVLFHKVDPEGPAADADLQPTEIIGLRRILIRDIIIGINGTRVRSSRDLLNALADHEPGDMVTLNLQRDNERVDVPVALGKESG